LIFIVEVFVFKAQHNINSSIAAFLDGRAEEGDHVSSRRVIQVMMW
jgi:hypothetical protein